MYIFHLALKTKASYDLGTKHNIEKVVISLGARKGS